MGLNFGAECRCIMGAGRFLKCGRGKGQFGITVMTTPQLNRRVMLAERLRERDKNMDKHEALRYYDQGLQHGRLLRIVSVHDVVG